MPMSTPNRIFIEGQIFHRENLDTYESLVYLDGTAFVVSVPKRTVITAMDGRTKDNIITNIDSAAIL